MNEPVDGGQRHCRISEDLAPFSKGLVGRDDHQAPFLARADQLEQGRRFSLVRGDVGQVVEDQHIEVVKSGERRFERQLATHHL